LGEEKESRLPIMGKTMGGERKCGVREVLRQFCSRFGQDCEGFKKPLRELGYFIKWQPPEKKNHETRKNVLGFPLIRGKGRRNRIRERNSNKIEKKKQKKELV